MSNAQLRQIWLFTAAVGSTGVGLWLPLVRNGEPHSDAVSMPILMFAALVAVFDTRWLSLDLHIRGRDATYVFVEIPVVLGVLFVDPALAMPVMAAATVLVHLLHRRSSCTKAIFNAANLTLRFGLCWSLVAAVRALVDVDPLSPEGWLLIGAASMTASLASDAISGAVVALATEQAVWPTIAAAASHSHFISLTSTAQGLMLGVLIVADPMSVLLFIAATSVFFIGTQAYAEEHSQRTTAEERALTDPMTGLANRAALNQALSDDLLYGVVYVDLDGFKAVNDIHGHRAGDEVIIETARRLRASVRGQDIVARAGGDEFVILLQPGSMVDEVAGRIEATLDADFTRGDVILPVGASVGHVERRPGEPAEQVIARADEAMYAKKVARRTVRRGRAEERR